MRMIALMAALALGALAASGCSGEDCTTHADCGDGRICTLGLCTLDPSAQGDVGGGADGVTLDCPAATAGDLVLTEILADPGGADANEDGDADGTDDEFIEVVNFTGNAIGLANVVVRVGTKDFGLPPVCLDGWGVHVLWGVDQSLSLANSGKTVSLVVDGEVVQTHAYGSEGGKAQSMTLMNQSDPDSEWVLHETLVDAPFSPGKCPGGQAFPGCEITDPADTDGSEPEPCDGVAPTAGAVILNEVNGDPGADANGDGVLDTGDDEFVELVNISGETVDLTGARIEDASGDGFEFPAGSCVAPNQMVVVFAAHDGAGGFDGALVFGELGTALNNGAETVTLVAVDGLEVLDSMSWSSAPSDQSSTREIDGDPASGWVKHTDGPLAAGAVHSPGRCQSGAVFPDCGTPPVVDPDASDDKTDATGGDIGPDPGPEPVCGNWAAPGDLVLNEILSDPGGKDRNGDGLAENTKDEFVEIVSLAGGPIDVAGVTLVSGASVLHTFAPTCVDAHHGLLVFAGGAPALNIEHALVLVSDKQLSLANDGEAVGLRDRDGAVLDDYTYSKAAGVSWVRQPDGTGAFVKHDAATEGGGQSSSPGLCIDGSALPSCL